MAKEQPGTWGEAVYGLGGVVRAAVVGRMWQDLVMVDGERYITTSEKGKATRDVGWYTKREMGQTCGKPFRTEGGKKPRLRQWRFWRRGVQPRAEGTLKMAIAGRYSRDRASSIFTRICARFLAEPLRVLSGQCWHGCYTMAQWQQGESDRETASWILSGW